MDFNKLKNLAKKTKADNLKLFGDGQAQERDWTITVPFNGGSNEIRFVIVPPSIGDGDEKIELYDEESGVLFPYFSVNVENKFGARRYLRTLSDDPVRKWAWAKFMAEKNNGVDASKRSVNIGTNYLALIYVLNDKHRPENNGTFQIISFSRTVGKEIVEEIDSDVVENKPIGFVDVGVIQISYEKGGKKSFGSYKTRIIDKPHDVFEGVEDTDAFMASMEEMAEKFRKIRKWEPDMKKYVSDFVSFVGRDDWIQYDGDTSFIQNVTAADIEDPTPKRSLKDELDGDDVPFDMDDVKETKVAEVKREEIDVDTDIDVDELF